MENPLVKSFLLLIIITGICSCAGARPIGSQNVIEVSGKGPDWIISIPDTERGVMYFRGIKTGAPTLDGGINDARMHAARQVAEMVESNADIKYESTRLEYGIPPEETDESSIIKDTINVLSKAIVKGIKEEATYYEKVEEVMDTCVSYFYNCYILVSLSAENYKLAIKRLFNEQVEKAKKARNERTADLLERMKRRMEEEVPLQTDNP